MLKNILKWVATILVAPIAIVILLPIMITGLTICGLVKAIKSVFD